MESRIGTAPLDQGSVKAAARNPASRLRHLLSARSWKIVLGIALAIILTALAFRGVPLSELLGQLRAGRIEFLLAALAVVLISPFLRAWRWKALFKGETPSLGFLTGAIATGQTLNLLIPFRSGDVSRVLLINERKWTAAGTIAVEKAVDSAFFAAICLTLPLVWAIPESLQQARLTAIMVSLALLLVGFLVLPRLPGMEIQLTPRTIGVLIASSVLIWGGSVINNYLLLRFVNLDLPLLAPLVLLVILQVGAAVPSTPGKVGIFQALSVLGLSFFGVAKPAAVAFGLALHGLVLFPVAAMALAFWIFRTKWRPLKLQKSR